ncbi:MAG: hypothetical protein LUI87_01685 [Lachnospiraceae bacterium]|nr:hypothetical protein [Lachnospiraceae bacterium]
MNDLPENSRPEKSYTWFQPLNHNSRNTGNYIIEAGEMQDIEFQDRWLRENDKRIPFFSITEVEKE